MKTLHVIPVPAEACEGWSGLVVCVPPGGVCSAQNAGKITVLAHQSVVGCGLGHTAPDLA